VSGPYETERQAREAARQIYEIDAALGAWTDANAGLLTSACADAGVVVGEYDAVVLRWLAGGEPKTCAVIAGLLTRAYEAGQAGPGGPGQAQRGGGWISGPSK
jgi:hypothetical protein